jgi:hypothetical protein
VYCRLGRDAAAAQARDLLVDVGTTLLEGSVLRHEFCWLGIDALTLALSKQVHKCMEQDAKLFQEPCHHGQAKMHLCSAATARYAKGRLT